MRGGRRLVVAAAAAALGLAVFSPVGAAPSIQTVHLVIRHSTYLPSELALPAGTTVKFVIHNTDPIDHELIVGSRTVQIRHEAGTEPTHGIVPGEITIPAGESAITTYRFRGRGVYLMGCHLPGHFAYGMRGTIRVR